MIFVSIIKEIINNWDPINLLSHAPNDEYKPEIEEVEFLLKSTKDISELSTGICNIFLKYFGDDIFQKSYSECTLIAKKILDSIH